jgi:hypothetical protein
MKIKLKIEKEFDVMYLQAESGVRYWEDTTVNDQEDTQGDLIPCRNGDYWKPLININTGIIENWQIGKKADIHYKCCDDGTYRLLDQNKKEIISIDGYVPNMMCPKEDGYGDYVIMDVDSEGRIQKWKVDFSYFQNNED